jgi:hypothetical protein
MKNLKEYDEFINEGWLSDLFKGTYKGVTNWFSKTFPSLGSSSGKKSFVKATDAFWKNAKVAKDTVSKKAKVSSTFNKADYWTLITIIACENYTTEKQGMSDTAQAIYNRYNVPGKPYGKTIREIILSKDQFTPVKEGKARGAKWDTIDTMQDAIEVYSITKKLSIADATKAITAAVQAQKDYTLAVKAGKHVQSRTEFLSGPPSKKYGAVNPVEREAKDKNNAFFWNYSGKKNFYAKNDLTPKAKPDSVKIS